MDISIAMIKERFISQGCVVLRESGKKNTPLAGVRLFDGIFLPNVLTIGLCDELAQSLGVAYQPLPEENKRVMCFADDMFLILDEFRLPKILNLVIDAFDYYRNYENQLMNAVYKGADMQELLDLTEPYFKNPAFIANWHGEVLAFTNAYANDYFRSAWQHIVRKRRLPLSSVQTLRNSPNYYTVTHKNTTAIFEFPDSNFTCIIGKMDSPLDYHLYLQIMQYQTPVTDTTCVLATMLLSALASISPPKEATSLSELFCDLLDKKPVDRDKLNWVLVTLGWEKCKRFLLLSFWNSEGSLTAEFLCGELKNSLVRGQMFIWNERPLMLICESDFGEVRVQIEQLVNELSFICGVSMPFSCWDMLPVQFTQTETAIRYCEQNCRISLCIDHIWKYLFDQLEDLVSISQLFHPAIITLADYDRKKNAQLLRTLYVYLSNERSLSLSADKLFIHRNTLLYRLHQINELINVDLSNEEVRAHIMLSYRMMKNADDPS
ncbi:helix-turn-helix domain-containing protein [uncultured Acetobacterium sp.]|uniref:helix-turn-helix domain-containing protein n=1 Tax=uncultured Acetobacterium sp. TaxID=217139 RepID=UPI0025DF6710|nr:helix-turn-helix domain-containing protein [uncultured Acetobacterium sp.]